MVRPPSIQIQPTVAKAALLLILLAFINAPLGWAQDYQLAKLFGPGNSDQLASVAIDNSGNIYVTGDFRATMDFDPGAAVSNQTAVGFSDIFVIKLDSNGDFVWGRKIGSTGWDEGRAIVVDSSGDLLITGSFENTVDFDPGAGTNNLSAVGGADAFALKLDANGDFVWARAFGGTGDVYAESIATDGSNNVCLTGYFRNTVDFDPGAGTNNKTSAGNSDVFAVKLNAAGVAQWAHTIGGTSSEFAYDVEFDATGNVFLAGSFRNTVDFDSGAGTSNVTSAGGNDAFTQKLDANGAHQWVVTLSSSGTEYANGLAVDATGNVYAVGTFQNTVDFDPGAGVTQLTSGSGSNDAYIQKLDGSGNLLWATATTGADDTELHAVVADAAGGVFVTGGFEGTVDLDPGAGTSNATAAGNDDVFIQRYSTSGTMEWSVTYGSIQGDEGLSVATDSQGDLYIGGYFEGTIDFDPGAGNVPLTAGADTDGFLQKLSGGGCTTPTTQLNAASCGTTLATLGQYIYTTAVAGADRYSYEFSNGSGFFEEVYNHAAYGAQTFFSPNWVPGLAIGTTYDVRVRARVAGCWGAYGNSCQISTPPTIPTTELATAYCNSTLPSVNTYFYINAVHGAQQYEYEVSDGSGYLETRTSLSWQPTATWFSLLYFDDIEYGTAYTIRVRAQIGGVWGSYGASCQLSTPALNAPTVQSSYCNTTLGSINQIFYATPVPGAQRYQYQVSDGAGFSASGFSYWANPTSNWFTFNFVPGIQSATTYDVGVRVKLAGTWGTFGPNCSISTPALKSHEADGAALQDGTQLRATVYPNPNNGQFRLHITGNAAPVDATVLDLSGRVVQRYQRLAGDDVELNLSAQPPGFYLLQLNGSSAQLTKRIVLY